MEQKCIPTKDGSWLTKPWRSWRLFLPFHSFSEVSRRVSITPIIPGSVLAISKQYLPNFLMKILLTFRWDHVGPHETPRLCHATKRLNPETKSSGKIARYILQQLEAWPRLIDASSMSMVHHDIICSNTHVCISVCMCMYAFILYITIYT